MFALQRQRRRAGSYSRLVLRHAALLAGEGQKQQHGQVPKTTEKQLAGVLPVAMAIEPEGQEADVKVNRQGD